MPLFTPPAGTYATTQAVTIISSTPNAIIRYTTDGTEPSPSNGIIYSGSVTVSANQALKAIAYKDGMSESSSNVAVYTINAEIPEGFIVVNGGTFSNGTADVTLSTYLIAKHELSQAEYLAVMEANPSYFTGDLSRPVERVTWGNAITYCNLRSMQDGYTPVYSYSTLTYRFNASPISSSSSIGLRVARKAP